MKISSKGRYGLQCMLYLALNDNGEPVALSTIAESQGISLLYLEQVFSALKKSHLVTSIKGPGGGYLLNKRSTDITIGDVVRVLEGDMPFAQMKEEGLDGAIDRYVWRPVDKAIKGILDSVTLAQLATQAQEDLNFNVNMFYI